RGARQPGACLHDPHGCDCARGPVHGPAGLGALMAIASAHAWPVGDAVVGARCPSGAPVVAAVSLSEQAGGIAAVSRMCWQVLQQAWPDAELVTLLSGPTGVN